jgi:hypothetical protein
MPTGVDLEALHHVPFDCVPNVEDFSPPKGSEIVDPFNQHAVFQALSNGPRVVLDASRQLVRGQQFVRHVSPFLHVR